MRVITIGEAKAHLARLVAKGAAFVIARDGKPVAKEVTCEPTLPHNKKRLGFSTQVVEIPDDFDHMCERDIVAMFNDKS